jgi:uncharacterized protein YcnI
MNRRTIPTIALAVLAGATLALAAPLAASAHVRVTPDQAEPGGYSQLTFRVPNESETAGTIRVEVALPQDTPFASVSYQPVAGWSATLTTTTLPKPVKVRGNELTEAVTSIVWQADAGVQIAPGQFQLFPVSVGPVPDTGSIALPATQTYSDGTVVEWKGAADAEEPAPLLYVNDAPAGDDHDAATTDTGSDDDVSVTSSTGAAASSDGVARGLGIGGLALGAVAVVLAAFAAFGRRRPRV